MEENTNVEVIEETTATEVYDSGETSGSGKGLMLIAGAAIATVVGIVAWRKHKKKKDLVDAESEDIDVEECEENVIEETK